MKIKKKKREKHADVKEKPWGQRREFQAASPLVRQMTNVIHLTPEIESGTTSGSTPGRIIVNDRRLNDQRFPRPEGNGRGRGSAPAYGAGANGHDTACAIKKNEENI